MLTTASRLATLFSGTMYKFSYLLSLLHHYFKWLPQTEKWRPNFQFYWNTVVISAIHKNKQQLHYSSDTEAEYVKCYCSFRTQYIIYMTSQSQSQIMYTVSQKRFALFIFAITNTTVNQFNTYYLDTKRALLGSRQRFHVNMCFSDKDRILIENWYEIKVLEQKTY